MTRLPWCFLAAVASAWLLSLTLGFYGLWSLATLPACFLGALGALLDAARAGWLRVPPRGGE
ncbi:MAG TPA: hypothetical protein VGF83_03445 [Actinomycetota bacterium]